MIEIIPAIDLIDGKCVRLSQGDFARKTIYNDDPLEVAKEFESAGVKRLHIVDLDGARRAEIANLAVLEKITAATRLVVDFGGGIKTDDDIRRVFDAGAAMANIGSSAVKTPEIFSDWLDKFGGDRILLGADARDGVVAIDGWQTATTLDVVGFLTHWFRRGVRQSFVTDIARDGLMTGPSIDLYKKISGAIPDLDLIASGGVNSVDDIRSLDAIGCSGVIIGKAIYEGKIDLSELIKKC